MLRTISVCVFCMVAATVHGLDKLRDGSKCSAVFVDAPD